MILEKNVDKLKVKVYANREELGNNAAIEFVDYVENLQKKQDNIRIIFAAAPSQNEFLEKIQQDNNIDWSKIELFHMDEYIGLTSMSPQCFGNFLKRKLFDNIKARKVNLIFDEIGTIQEICLSYSKKLQEKAIDIVCLGIGENGHIAFNDPDVAEFNDSKVVKEVFLDELCRKQQVNDGCFESLDKVPKSALTLTIPTLISGKKLFCMVPGKTKTNAVHATLNGRITKKCPASILRKHKDCTLYLDKESYGLKGE